MYLIIFDNYLKITDSINLNDAEKESYKKIFKINENEMEELKALIKIMFKHQIEEFNNNNIIFNESFDYESFVNFLLEQSKQNIFNIEEYDLNDKIENEERECYFVFLLINNERNYLEFGKTEILNYNEIEFLNNNFELDRDFSYLIKLDYENCKNLFNSMLLDAPFKKKEETKNTIIYYLKSEDLVQKVYYLFKLKLEILAKFKDVYKIDLKTKKITNIQFKKTKLTSNEVCEILGISNQLLMYWRKTGRIKFQKLSKKVILYDREEVEKLKELKEIFEIENSNKKDKKINLNHTNKKVSKEKNKKSDLTKLYKLVNIWSYRVQEDKKRKNFYFANLSNLIPNSSPLVMINNNGEIQDYISKKIYYKSDESYDFLKSKFEKGLEPMIDKSEKKYKGFEKFYFDEVKNYLISIGEIKVEK